MAKHLCDINIGYRAADCVDRHGPSPAKELKRLRLERKRYYDWKSGIAPSAFAFQQMALNGYDIRYILTGKKEVTP